MIAHQQYQKKQKSLDIYRNRHNPLSITVDDPLVRHSRNNKIRSVFKINANAQASDKYNNGNETVQASFDGNKPRDDLDIGTQLTIRHTQESLIRGIQTSGQFSRDEAVDIFIPKRLLTSNQASLGKIKSSEV